MSINSISHSNSAALYAAQSMQKPDPSNTAEDLFTKLDTKSQGYLEKSDLETALSKISNAGGSDSSMSADEMFAKLDSDGDGKVTKQEMSATFEQIASELDGPFPRMRMQGQGETPLPPQHLQEDEGLSKEQLTSMLENIDSTGNQSNLLSQLVNNFDTADSDGNGKVTHDEAMSYRQANAADTASETDSNTSASSTNTSDIQFMKQVMELMKAYSGFNSESNGNSFSSSV